MRFPLTTPPPVGELSEEVELPLRREFVEFGVDVPVGVCCVEDELRMYPVSPLLKCCC